MITDEQVKAAIAEFYKSGTGNCGMRKVLEAYEQSKPKPEPYCYVSKTLDGEFFPTQEKLTDSDFPLYTAPPTREPLSDYELREILNDLNEGDGTIYDFARTIEQAHGIGTTND